MADSHSAVVILLRAIGPATHRLMSMAQWRDAAESAGFGVPETLVNTGNMIARYDGDEAAAAGTMKAVLRGFGLGENVVPMVRRPALLQTIIGSNPVPAAQNNQTGVYFFVAEAPDFGWLKDYDGPERVHVVADHLVVDFTRDVAQSGRLIRLIDKNCGTNTARNWNSVRRIAERCSALEG